MGDSNIDMQYGTVKDLLDHFHLSDAMDILETMAREARASRELDELGRIRSNYGYMLHYMADGCDDPHRARMHKEMVESLRRISDAVKRLHHSESDSDYYSAQLRMVNMRRESIPVLMKEYSSAMAECALADMADNGDSAVHKRKEDALERLFSVVYTSIGENEEYKAIVEAIRGGDYDSDFSLVMTSALTLALLAYYDTRKFWGLVDIYESASGSEDALAARALVGMMFVMARYPDRITDDESVMARLSLWLDSEDIYSDLRETVRAIIASRDTQRVVNKLKDDVLPELMRIRPDLMKKMGDLKTDLETSLMEGNPEWEELLEKSGLSKKLREISELHSDGADLFMVSFSNLKSYPFFRDAVNWFLPFSLSHSSLASLPEVSAKLLDTFYQIGGSVANSDLYSMAFAVSNIPAAQREMMQGQFRAQMEAMSVELKDRNLKVKSVAFNTEVLRYVRDLYRFFKLFRRKEDFYDPFSTPLDFMSLPVVGQMLERDEMLGIVSEFYFKRGYYKEALPAYLALSASHPNEAVFFEKIGFCHQKMQRFEEALSAYGKAELLRAPGPWLLRRIAVTAKRLGDFDKASEYYARCLDCDPENLSLIMSAGHVELERGNIVGALSHYYHANYLAQDDVEIIRALGWLELINGNFGKSASFYARIPDEQFTAADALNLGHAYLLDHDTKGAVASYRRSLKMDATGFVPAFEADIPTLEPLGLDRREALILLDAIRQ